MLQPRIKAADAACPELNPDWIEETILRTYLQFMVRLGDAKTGRTVTIASLGSVYLSLTETSHDDLAGFPPFLLEFRSHVTGRTVDRLGCYDFDDDELEHAVEFVHEGAYRLRTLH